MKIVKKILAIVISVILSISVFSICASAAGTAAGNEAMTVTVTTDKQTYSPSDTVTVSITVSCNYNATCLRFPVMYDASVYEMPTLINLTAYNTCKSSGTMSSNIKNDGTFIPSNYTAANFGCILIQWTATVTGGTVGCLNNSTGELCFTFQLKTKASAAGKTGSIFIPPESDLFYYQAIQTPTDATTFYYMNKTTDTLTFVAANASVVGEEVALVANTTYNSKAVVDNTNLYVYGLATGIASAADIKTYVAATGGATIRCVSAELGFGTGTLINLLVDTTIVKTYKVIIFGDVNGDAVIDLNDITAILPIASGTATSSDASITFASDLNGDGAVDLSDLSILLPVASGSTVINQVSPY